MKQPVHVIVPTLYRHPAWAQCAASWRHLPQPHVLHLVQAGRSWGEAINIGLRAVPAGADVVLLDDDVELAEGTFAGLSRWAGLADILGFKLYRPDGSLQHSGAFVFPSSRYDGYEIGHRIDDPEHPEHLDRSDYALHVTASCMYIRAPVLARLGGVVEHWPGMQFEDVDFCLRAVEAGFRILYVPQAAVHHETATKKIIAGEERFHYNNDLNYEILKLDWLTNKPRVQALVGRLVFTMRAHERDLRPDSDEE